MQSYIVQTRGLLLPDLEGQGVHCTVIGKSLVEVTKTFYCTIYFIPVYSLSMIQACIIMLYSMRSTVGYDQKDHNIDNYLVYTDVSSKTV